MIIVATTDGVRVWAGDKNGLTQAQAEASAAWRNALAEKMGIKARYTVAEVDDE